jgi:hypothetical protein
LAGFGWRLSAVAHRWGWNGREAPKQFVHLFHNSVCICLVWLALGNLVFCMVVCFWILCQTCYTPGQGSRLGLQDVNGLAVLGDEYGASAWFPIYVYLYLMFDFLFSFY